MTTNKVDVKNLLWVNIPVSFIRNWLWTGLLLTLSSQTHIALQQTQTGRGHYGYLWHKETAKSFGWRSASEHILHWHPTRRTGLGLQIDLPCPPTRINVHLSRQSDLRDSARWQCVQGVKGGRRNSDIPTLLRELLLSESDGIVDRTL